MAGFIQNTGLNNQNPPPNQQTAQILNILIQMKNSGKSNYTIQNTSKALKYLNTRTDLNNPEAVKTLIANLNISTNYKHILSVAYTKYAQYYKLNWEMPHYKQTRKLIKIPTHEKIQMIIAESGKTIATKLQLSLETGLRPIELHNLKVKDIDLTQRLVYPTTAKNGLVRILKISNTLTQMIQDHIIRNNLKETDQLFKGTPISYAKK